MNIQEKLVDEFERLIILREKYRTTTRNNAARIALDPILEQQIANNMTAINEVIIFCKQALGNDDAVDTLKALHMAEGIDE